MEKKTTQKPTPPTVSSKKTRNRQDVFDTIWYHYVVEGNPYAASRNNIYNMTEPVYKAGNNRSPMMLFFPARRYTQRVELQDYKDIYNVIKGSLAPHVTFSFMERLQDCHAHAVGFTFDNINDNKIKNIYARRMTRAFRRMIKYLLIDVAMDYDLTVPGDRPTTIHAKMTARKNKK